MRVTPHPGADNGTTSMIEGWPEDASPEGIQNHLYVLGKSNS